MANHVLLETIVLTQNASSVVFDNIPTTGYTDLKLVASARSTRAGNAEDGFGIRLNASTSGYTYKVLGGNGSSLYNLNSTYEQTWVCNLPAATATSGVFGNAEAYIPNYRSSSAKSYSTDGNSENNSNTGYLTMGSIIQSSTDPISSITCLAQNGSLAAGSTISLYGIAAVGTTPAIAPLATGGNIVANDGTYWYHAFLNSGFFVPQINLTCDYLVVAGGGGGGDGQGGGGGAGGLRSTVTATGGGGSLPSARAFTSLTSYSITIGAGGIGSRGNSRPGTDGTSSLITGSGFTTISTTGGGGGGGNSSQILGNGRSGGSGGGGTGDYATTGGSATANEGYPGGAGIEGSSGNRPSGGGGGAGQAGIAGVPSNAGNGGNGVQITALATPTLTGANSGYYAGGGGGGGSAAGDPNPGGLGGGGAGSTSTGTDGIINTGGGGGGSANAQQAGHGASGIVIIRYSMAS